MNLLIRMIDFAYGEEGDITEVNVRFDGNDRLDGTNLNGSVRLTKAEYDSSDKSLDALSEIAKGKVKEKLFAEKTV